MAGPVLAVAVMVFALTALEFALRFVGPQNDGYYVWPPGMTRALHPDSTLLPGIHGTARFTANRLGLRGPEPVVGDSVYRILMVGGSTTENLYLDDAEAWPQLVHDSLAARGPGIPVWIASAGRSGLNSRDHVVQLERLLPQLGPLDLVVVLVGVNDLTVSLGQGWTYRSPPSLSDAAAQRYHERRAFSLVPGGLHTSATGHDGAPWFKRTALWQLVSRARANLSARSGTAPAAGGDFDIGRPYEQWREYRRRATTIVDSLPNLRPALDDYRTHLLALHAVATRAGVPLVLMTQPSIWRADLSEGERRSLWLGGIGDFQTGTSERYFSPASLAAAMAAFNAELLDLCTDRALDCLDLATAIPRDSTAFFDDVHFTERGSAAVATQVTPWIERQIRARRPTTP